MVQDPFPSEVVFSKRILESDVDEFARVSGDLNPLHMQDSFASKTVFGKRVVHGMFLASLFSRVVGMELGRQDVLYLSQSLQFRNPVFIGDEVVVKFVKKSFSESTKVALFQTTINCGQKVCVSGEAQVRLL